MKERLPVARIELEQESPWSVTGPACAPVLLHGEGKDHIVDIDCTSGGQLLKRPVGTVMFYADWDCRHSRIFGQQHFDCLHFMGLPPCLRAGIILFAEKRIDWITLIIQKADKSPCIENINLAEVLRFTDRFLSRQLRSGAQDYSNVTNMREPVFQQLSSGYLAAYPLNASEPPMDAVCIYTDGRTVIVNLQERRKVVGNQQRTDPVP